MKTYVQCAKQSALIFMAALLSACASDLWKTPATEQAWQLPTLENVLPRSQPLPVFELAPVTADSLAMQDAIWLVRENNVVTRLSGVRFVAPADRLLDEALRQLLSVDAQFAGAEVVPSKVNRRPILHVHLEYMQIRSDADSERAEVALRLRVQCSGDADDSITLRIVAQAQLPGVTSSTQQLHASLDAVWLATLSKFMVAIDQHRCANKRSEP
jgi:uncharacterized lipoprotein YmbA